MFRAPEVGILAPAVLPVLQALGVLLALGHGCVFRGIAPEALLSSSERASEPMALGLYVLLVGGPSGPLVSRPVPNTGGIHDVRAALLYLHFRRFCRVIAIVRGQVSQFRLVTQARGPRGDGPGRSRRFKSTRE